VKPVIDGTPGHGRGNTRVRTYAGTGGTGRVTAGAWQGEGSYRIDKVELPSYLYLELQGHMTALHQECFELVWMSTLSFGTSGVTQRRP
jgi:hypothetical protein